MNCVIRSEGTRLIATVGSTPKVWTHHKQSLRCKESIFFETNDFLKKNFLLWFHQILGTVPTVAGVNLVPSDLVTQVKKYQLSSLSVSVFSTVMMQMFRERWCSYLSCKKHKNPESFRDKKNLRFKVKYSLQYLYLYNDKFCNRNKLQLPCFHDSTY